MQQQGNVSFNVRDADDGECDECKSKYFVQIYRIKRISPVISPTGEEIMAPIQLFKCSECNHINESFLE